MCDSPTSFPLSFPSARRNSRHDEEYIGSVHRFERRSRRYILAKRSLDIFVACWALVILFPVFPILMLLVKCSSSGPVFYKHLRVGQFGRPFYLYKFRTMWCNNDLLLRRHLARHPAARLEWERSQKLRSDPRVTPIGACIRRFSLDELPQLLNVLLGDMSLVGPRPIVREEIGRYRDAFPVYASVKPGLTGLWQVSGRGCLPYERRVELDIEYVSGCSLLRDLTILMRTPRAIRE